LDGESEKGSCYSVGWFKGARARVWCPCSVFPLSKTRLGIVRANAVIETSSHIHRHTLFSTQLRKIAILLMPERLVRRISSFICTRSTERSPRQACDVAHIMLSRKSWATAAAAVSRSTYKWRSHNYRIGSCYPIMGNMSTCRADKGGEPRQ
jgi:hypothetical protein